ncbi:hypothetical protein K8R66_01565 [bacterium]|nr:hypothetical protein [bacterium]
MEQILTEQILKKPRLDPTKKNEEVEGKEKSISAYTDKVKDEIEQLKKEQEENLKHRDEIYKKVYDLVGGSSEDFKKNIELGNGWLFENKISKYYGYNLNEEQEEKYQDLVFEAIEFLKQNERSVEKIQENNRRIELVEKGKTKDGKDDLISRLKDPKGYQNKELIYLSDTLMDSGILTDFELVQALNGRVSNLGKAWEENQGEGELTKFLERHTFGPKESDIQLDLKDLPKEIVDRIKQSSEASPQLIKALEFDLIDK